MIGRLRQYAREHGAKATIEALLSRLRRSLVSSERMTILLKDLDQISAPKRPSGLRVEEMTRAHLDGLSQLNRERHRPRVDHRFRKNLKGGLRGFVGLVGDKTVGYYWWIEGEKVAAHPDMDFLGGAFEVDVADVYGSDFYVLPDHRAGGTANDFLFAVESNLEAHGFRRIWGYVDSGNRQARWIYSSRGYRPMGEVSSRRLLFHRKTTPEPKVGTTAHE